LEDAKIQAAEIGISHRLVETHEMANPNYTSNPINRCYFCKSELYDTLKPLAQSLGYSYTVDGVNGDDLHDYRPGIQAAKERGTRSPLAEVGFSKLEVRELSKKLRRVGQAERYLRNLGFTTLRVRSEGVTAKIELPVEVIQGFIQANDLPRLVEAFQSYGFTYVTLDLEGFRSGKLNQVLATPTTSLVSL
jgi:pyridinium-3,5-biscarboxylic acid mononucleotide sulfurtransferase